MERLNSFKPGALWLDTLTFPINAHGGGILYEGVYYWFGEHKIEGGQATRRTSGSCLFLARSYNWNDEGIALEGQ